MERAALWAAIIAGWMMMIILAANLGKVPREETVAKALHERDQVLVNIATELNKIKQAGGKRK